MIFIMVVLVMIVVIIMATTVSMIVYATIILCAFRVLALCYSSSPKKPLSVMLRSWPDMEFIAWQLINTWYFNLSIPYNIACILGRRGQDAVFTTDESHTSKLPKTSKKIAGRIRITKPPGAGTLHVSRLNTTLLRHCLRQWPCWLHMHVQTHCAYDRFVLHDL